MGYGKPMFLRDRTREIDTFTDFFSIFIVGTSWMGMGNQYFHGNILGGKWEINFRPERSRWERKFNFFFVLRDGFFFRVPVIFLQKISRRINSFRSAPKNMWSSSLKDAPGRPLHSTGVVALFSLLN